MAAGPYHTFVRMESSSEEDTKEFFETFEYIQSSPGTQSEGDDDDERYPNASHVIMGRVSNDRLRSQLSLSKYEIWKSNPGSILERRRRLLSQMGVKLESDDPEDATVSPNPALPVSGASDSSSIFPAVVAEAERTVNFTEPARSAQKDDGGNDQMIGITDAKKSGCSMVRSRSDGTFPRLPSENGMDDYSARLVRSGTTSPVVSSRIYERLLDESGAVLRTGSVHNRSSSKPPLGVKRTSGTGTSPASRSFETKAAQRSQSYWSKLQRGKFTGRNGKLSSDLGSLDGEYDDETLQRLFKDGRFSIESSDDVGNSEDGEVLCRIKDLDSGKEFVVNEVGKDGLWNKLRELETGRELTLEEFETSLGLSPIVQEVMRRERAADDTSGRDPRKKKRGWLKAIKKVVRGSREKENGGCKGSDSEDREASTEKSERRSRSATDDSQGTPPQITKRIKVNAHKKTTKEFGELHLRQEIQGHQGAIWTMKFSLDGSYLATAGQDRIVRVWEVSEQSGRAKGSPDTSGELRMSVEKSIVESSPQRQKEVKKSDRSYSGRKRSPISTSQFPKLFLLSEISKCAFEGHTEDILDLAWSPSQSLLSSSMDKTVRLWDVSSRECLRIFTHNDYVTCIQINPADEGYFISGSLDGKVRIWSIKERQVVDWTDLREMITAACYTPDGQRAVVGSYKGTCRFYKTSGNKLQLDTFFQVQSNKKKRSQGKKITGFEFIPGDRDKILITSSDSHIRVYNGSEISSKYKGLRNTKSQISASFSSNGKYIICASEDSRVCIWNYSDSKSAHGKDSSGSYEAFSAQHVLVAIPWPGMGPRSTELNFGAQGAVQKSSSQLVDLHAAERKLVDNSPTSTSSDRSDDNGICCDAASFPCKSAALMTRENRRQFVGQDFHVADSLVCNEKASPPSSGITSLSISDSYLRGSCGGSIFSREVPVGSHGFFSDSKGSATWPEEKLPPVQQTTCTTNTGALTVNSRTSDGVPTVESGIDKSVTAIASAWGLVIVTAGWGGEIRTFQNYSVPVQL